MIEKKLRSRAGASLIAALFLFLFCAMTGTVILTAASANAGRMAFNSNGKRVSRSEAVDRDYYKVTSAAKLFAEQIKGTKVALTLKRDIAYDEYGNIIPGSEAYSSTWETTPAPQNALTEFLENAIKSVYPAGNEITYWNNGFSIRDEERNVDNLKTFTITLQDDDPDSELSKLGADKITIYGRVTLQVYNCAVYAIFSSADFGSGAIPNDAYFLQMICVPERTVSLDADADTKTVAFTWNDAQILEGR